MHYTRTAKRTPSPEPVRACLLSYEHSLFLCRSLKRNMMQLSAKYEEEYLPTYTSHTTLGQQRDPREYDETLDRIRGADNIPTSPDFPPSTSSFYQSSAPSSPCFPWTALGPAFGESAAPGEPVLSYSTGASSSETTGAKGRNLWEDLIKESETMEERYQRGDSTNTRMLKADEVDALSDEARAYHFRGIAPPFAGTSSKFGRSSGLETDRSVLVYGSGQRKYSGGSSARTVAPVANHYPASFSSSNLDSRSEAPQYIPFNTQHLTTVPSLFDYRTPDRPSRPSLPEARLRLPVLPHLNLEEHHSHPYPDYFEARMSENSGLFFHLPPLNVTSLSANDHPASANPFRMSADSDRLSHSPSSSITTTSSEYLLPFSSSPTNSEFSPWFHSSPPHSEYSDYSPSPVVARQTTASSSYSPPSRFINTFHSMSEEDDVISRYMDCDFIISPGSDEGERKRLNLGNSGVGKRYEEKGGTRVVERVKMDAESGGDLRPISPITGLPVKILAKRSNPPKDAARRV